MAVDDLLSDFIAETREGLEALDSELVRFEQRPDDPETLGGIFRLIHTIKGTCGFLGLMRLQTVAHAAENVLGAFRDGILPVTPMAVSTVLDTVDLIRSLIDSLAAAGVEAEGDDSALIARLEAVLDNDAETTAMPPADKAAATPDGRSLIERLGGDSGLDAAVESALAGLPRDSILAAQFSGIDPDRLQAALRDSLSALARRPEGRGGFAEALERVGGMALTRPVLAEAFGAVAVALGELDVADEAIGVLRDLALPADEPESPSLADVPPLAQAAAVLAPPAVAAPENAGPAQTIRVSVEVLEHLMTVASELVLIRNQLNQTLRLEPESPFAAPLNRLNQVTSELQEGVMTTRMQPISGAWAKLPRLVRDLAQDLGKGIDLVMLGQETELDRQVLELIRDPLTHMIRNAADHGLETPAERRAAGKSEIGRITLQARHEGGAIVIDVHDDGRGLPVDKIRAKALGSGLITPLQAEQMSDADARNLIFLPGFSTADQVTSVSGRGVGMDVVRTNIEKIGGVIEVSSAQGGGTHFTIQIPLTLTIVSALIVECSGERFAMPQSSVVELISASGASGHAVEYIDGTAVLRLRDRLLPLICLQSLLALEPAVEPSGETCIVVVRVGAFNFGVIVDRVFDTEEIVVKPVAKVLRHLKLYSGATILGDGSVILILDPKGISLEAGAGQGGVSVVEDAHQAANGPALTPLLVFRAANDLLKAAPLAAVSRIEEIVDSQIETVDGCSVIQYRGKLMPILDPDARPATRWTGGGRRPLLVFTRGDRAAGLLVEEIVDIVNCGLELEVNANGEGAMGSLIIAGRATELIDVDYYCGRALNDGPAAPGPTPAAPVAAFAGGLPAAPAKRLLVVDSSPFSQAVLRPLLSQAGYEVTVASSPDAALALHEAGEAFHLIMADTHGGPASARAFADVLGRAANWHSTPLLEMTFRDAGDGLAVGLGSGLLDAVAGAIGGLRRAA